MCWSNFPCCRARKASRPPGNLLTPPGEACPPIKNHWSIRSRGFTNKRLNRHRQYIQCNRKQDVTQPISGDKKTRDRRAHSCMSERVQACSKPFRLWRNAWCLFLDDRWRRFPWRPWRQTWWRCRRRGPPTCWWTWCRWCFWQSSSFPRSSARLRRRCHGQHKTLIICEF